ncbi:MAG: T9SS type A sorting domain-containing protein [Chitinophagales bacterium]
MKKIYISKNAGKLAAYSAMAGAFVATTTEAKAEVVYSDPDDVTVELGQYLPVDIDGDGGVDFMILCTSLIPSNWTAGVAIGYYAGLGYGNPSNFMVGYNLGILPYGSALNSGDMIDAGAGFTSYYTAFLASIYSGATYGAFANQTDKYLGFQFIAGDGDLHYGWMRLDATVGPVTITVKDYAYDDVANYGIEAGQTTGGGTAGVELLNENQVTVYSYANTINLIVKDVQANVSNVVVTNLNGQVVYTGDVNGNAVITLDNAATGIYNVQLMSENSVVYNKKVFINN